MENLNLPYILYVEDDQLEAMRFQIALKVNDFEGKVDIALNGEEALEKLKEKRHDLPRIIILDLNMPVMNGFEFLTTIKNDISFRRIPIIILTTSENENDILQSYDFQVAGYFTKPFNPNKYNQIIARIKSYWEMSKTIKL
jgi:CheY-like chemotaxis protein